MAFLKPQSPLSKGNDYFYPLTTADQVIMDGGYRLDQIVGKVEKSTVTLYQNGWSTAAPYSYSIMVKGLADDLNMKVLPHYPENFAEKQILKEEFAKVSFCSRQGNIVTFECWDEVPSVNIDVDIEINVLYPLEAAVDMDEIESRLPKLNYSVVGGTTEPANPTENMIWVNTEAEIGKICFSGIKPSSVIDNDIWIYTGTNSIAGFDAIKIGNNIMNTIYPLSAQQYIDGAWVDKSAKIYQNGEWVDWWSGELYTNGNQHTDVTGGWGSLDIGWFWASSEQYLNPGTINTVNMVLNPVNGKAAVIGTKNKINLSSRKTLKVLLTSTITDSTRAYIGVCSTREANASQGGSSFAGIKFFTAVTNEIVELDLSTIDGEYYIVIIADQAGKAVTIYRVWVE